MIDILQILVNNIFEFTLVGVLIYYHFYIMLPIKKAVRANTKVSRAIDEFSEIVRRWR